MKTNTRQDFNTIIFFQRVYLAVNQTSSSYMRKLPVVCLATSAVKLSVLTTQFKWSIIIAREAIISCKWF